MKLITLGILTLAFGAVGLAQTSKYSYYANIGIVDRNYDQKKTCLTIKNGKLKPGTKLTLIKTWERPHQRTFGTITGRLADACTDGPTTGEAEGQLHYYSVDIADKKNAENFYASFAIVGTYTAKRAKNGAFSFDLDGDGRNENFRDCTSMEGIHMTVWNGAPLKSKRVFHWYFYLRYDTKPTCKNADTRRT